MVSASEAVSIRADTQQTSANSVCDATNRMAGATPSMKQYWEIKSRHPDCILFYRMGDFYELFFEDAQIASPILDIALTKRGKQAGEDVPMCGVPVHAAEMYLPKLIASGHKIAICEQLESPEEAKKRGYKEIVRRDVVRIVTPGTITEETLLAPTTAHYLAALSLKADAGGLAWLDLSTGEFICAATSSSQLPSLLARIAPRELLLTQATYELLASQPWFFEWKNITAIRPDAQFEASGASRRIREHYNVGDSAVFGEFTQAETAACGALIDYVKLTQMDAAARIDPPHAEQADDHLQMDAATRRNLELVQTLGGARRGSLLATIDETVTAPGGRLLSAWLSAPSRQLHTIASRHEAVAWALEHAKPRETIRSHLKSIADMERALGRLSLGRGGPRDLLLLATGLTGANALHEMLRPLTLPQLLNETRSSLFGLHALADQRTNALKPEVPHLVRDGNFIADGFRADLDEWRRLRDESRRVIAVMEQKLKSDTGITSLKIKHNNVIGYFIEITQIHEKKVPTNFIHRQGLAGSLRYTTDELNDTARKIDEAADKSLKLELMLFDELVATVLSASPLFIAAARALATIDTVTALAQLAEAGNWVRPTITSGTALAIKEGRHPVVEAALRRQHREFIANDCAMNEQSKLHLITGPNMGGKSTFLRQQAILVILAQMGSFVPAVAAEIGLVDKLFCRVGAADDLARGQSTFMVEMVETASILHQATEQSLVVLDEIGRGTATYDGVSIAWAVAEHLHNATRCRALFATHYHELTALSDTLPRLKNYHASAKEYQGQLIFLHTIREGAADQSYGIHVAALAGMPKPVLTRARELLTTLESGHSLTERTSAPELPLFSHATTLKESEKSKLAERIEMINVDTLTPIEALNILAELKKL